MHLERAHMGMFTELGILYSKFKPEKLLEHIKLFHDRLNIPKLLTVCERNLQWSELCLLHCYYDEYDSAATKMMDHTDAWNHTQFKDIITKVSNLEIYYKAIDVYLDQHPSLLCDLLAGMAARIDNSRVVSQLRRAGQLPLIQPYLLIVQQSSKPEIPEVNEAINQLYVEEEDVDALRASIENYPTFDQLQLANKLEKHSLLRFRRLATWLYTRNKRYAHAVELSKADQMYQDAMEATAASGDSQVAEDLLRFFASEVDERDRAPCFAACLYTCYDILNPDVVMEVAWLNDLKEYAMPYFINATREYTTLVRNIRGEVDQLKQQKIAADEERQQALSQDLEAAAANTSTIAGAMMGGISPMPITPSPNTMGMPGSMMMPGNISPFAPQNPQIHYTGMSNMGAPPYRSPY